jgi:hypothetical protein
MIKLIAFGITLSLFIHLTAGHSFAHITNDFTKGSLLLIGGMLSFILLQLAIKIIKIPLIVWQRNRRAFFLAQKVNGLKDLTTEEQTELDILIKEGVLNSMPYVYREKWHVHVKLSSSAVHDILHR